MDTLQLYSTNISLPLLGSYSGLADRLYIAHINNLYYKNPIHGYTLPNPIYSTEITYFAMDIVPCIHLSGYRVTHVYIYALVLPNELSALLSHFIVEKADRFFSSISF